MTSQKTKIKRGFAVGSAVVIGSVSGDTFNCTTTISSVILPSAISSSNPSFLPPLDQPDAALSPLTISIPPEEPEWNSAHTRRFKELAMKRADLSITHAENDEFLDLQRRRRMHATSLVPDEVLNEWHRRRFVTRLVDLLSCNVSFFQSEDQARVRSFGQTTRS